MKERFFVFAAIAVALSLLVAGCIQPGGPVADTVPGTPTEVTATGVDKAVTVSWGTVSGATSYDVQYKTSAAAAWGTPINVTATTRQVTGLNNGTEYEFQVRAKNSVGTSGWSTSVKATPNLPVPNVKASAGEERVTVSWDTVSGATSYEVQYKESTKEDWTDFTGTITGNSCVVRGLINDTEYNFQVRAKNSTDTSGWSSSVSATPKEADAVPEAPGNVEASAGNASVTVSWDLVDGANSYNVEYKVLNGSSWQKANTGPIEGIEYTVTGLTNGTEYSFQVTAVNSKGDSEPSDAVSATPEGAFSFKEDFAGYTAGDDLKSGDLWEEANVAKTATAKVVTGAGGATSTNMLEVDAYISGQADKVYMFKTTKNVSANFKLETRFQITQIGGWPQLQIAPTGTFGESAPLFWYHVDNTVRLVYPKDQDGSVRHQVAQNLADSQWYTMTLTGYGDVYTLYVDGTRIGRINTQVIDSASISAGPIQVRVQDMLANFDYFELTEFDGEDPFTLPADWEWEEDFSGYSDGDDVTAIGFWSEMPVWIAGDNPYSEVDGNMLGVFTYDAVDADVLYSFESTLKTPDNFKLEVRFKITNPGGWPQLIITPAGEFLDGVSFNSLSGSSLMHKSSLAPTDVIDTDSTSLVDSSWHIMVLTGYCNAYTLYVDDNKIGNGLDTVVLSGAGVIYGPSTVQLRVQSMDVYFDYFKVTEYEGGDL